MLGVDRRGLAIHGLVAHHVVPPLVAPFLHRDVGAGALYVLARINDWGGAAISHATADYGTKYLIVAGLLNFIAAADAHHIALGKKP